MDWMHGVRWRAALCGLLALALLLVFAANATAARYAVAQCGWHVGQDAGWSDTTGGAKFRPSSFCAAPAGQDPFDGVHMKSFTRDGAATVSGTRFARWRWDAPPGTGITAIRGTWWHALHDGIEHRIGAASGGGFDVFAAAGATDTVLREFSAGFPAPRQAIEDRLLCARGEDRSCSLESGSFSALRAVTLTLEDNSLPVSYLGGQVTEPGWRRGAQAVGVGAADAGSGVRFSQTLVDATTTGISIHPCDAAEIGGELRATRLRPCEPAALASQSIETGQFSDGPHAVRTCAADFASNYACSEPRQVLIDNNPPAAPRALAPLGAEGWRRSGAFELAWTNPDQGPASPIAGASWRVTGPEGFDTGVRFLAGEGIAALPALTLPRAGTYVALVWLRDAAGNEAAANAASAVLRFDDVAPAAAFRAIDDPAHPEALVASAADGQSGVASGEIAYRRVGREEWTDLVTEVAPAPGPAVELTARFPSDEVPEGEYELRATVADGAGNVTQTTLRADGTAMRLRVPLKARTRITAWVRGAARPRGEVTTAFGARTTLSGRLTRADGSGIAAARLALVVRPSEGSLRKRVAQRLATGPKGGFSLRLAAGPSRRLVLHFAGNDALAGAGSRPLAVRVRSGITLQATPPELETGEDVSLGGRVATRGTKVPRRGKLVAIQYLESQSDRWRPVLVTRTDRAGRFHARYRFRYVTGTARIKLRAMALPEESWPYAPGHSEAVTVLVHGGG